MDQETREFLNRKFNAIDEKFAGIDEKFARIDEKFARIDEKFARIDERFEDTKRHFGVVAEGLRNEIQQVAEGHQAILDGQARIMDRIEQVERELGAMIRFSYAELDRRIRALEEDVVAIKTRVERLEARQNWKTP